MRRAAGWAITLVFAMVFAIGTLPACAEEKGPHELLNDLILKYSKKNVKEWKNKDIQKFFEKQGFREGLDAYLEGEDVRSLTGGFSWHPGMGEDWIGPMSGWKLKDLFTDYCPLPVGPVLNPKKTYRIGFTTFGYHHPWLLANAENAVWEANKHPNIKFEVLDAEFDDAKMNTHIDNWVAKGYDGIMIWPSREFPNVAAIDRAEQAGIPCVDMDRKVASQNITHIVGNLRANGVQLGLYILWKTQGKGGNIVLSRKEMGATADITRTGGLLEVLGDYPGYKVVASYHTDSNAPKSYAAVKDALQAYKDIDIIMTTGDEEGKGALRAVLEANRMNSSPKYGKILIVICDDQREVLEEVKKGNIDVVAPYTPLSSALGLRALINRIGVKEGLIKEQLPRVVVLPNLPMITQNHEDIFGIKTVTPDEWPYAYGAEMKIKGE